MTASHDTRYATLLAAIMHAAGIVGIAMGYGSLFSLLTPFNLMTMLGLLIWTAPERSRLFFIFFMIAFLTGCITEIIGVNTSLLFGHYQYGTAFGPKLLGVPLLIGINWFVVVYASGMIAQEFCQWISLLMNRNRKQVPLRFLKFSLAFYGAIIATAFDYIMEPAAVKLGFWTWQGGVIPILNYMSWFGISFLLLILFQKSTFKLHKFAIYLLLIQGIFFTILRAYF